MTEEQYLHTIDIFLNNAIDEDSNNIKTDDISYYENLFTEKEEYKKLW